MPHLGGHVFADEGGAGDAGGEDDVAGGGGSGGGDDGDMQDHPGLMRSKTGISAGGTGFIAQRNQATSNAKAVKQKIVTISAMELISFYKRQQQTHTVCLCFLCYI